MPPVECFDISPNGNEWNDSDGVQVRLIFTVVISEIFLLSFPGSYKITTL